MSATVCIDCGAEPDALIAGRCVDCDDEMMRESDAIADDDEGHDDE